MKHPSGRFAFRLPVSRTSLALLFSVVVLALSALNFMACDDPAALILI